MNDERPSLNRLRELNDQSTWLNDHINEVAAALPSLLESATAALRIQAWHDSDNRSQAELEARLDELMTATRKVRP